MVTTRPLRKVQTKIASSPLDSGVFDSSSDDATLVPKERPVQRKPVVTSRRTQPADSHRILHIGCGQRSPARLHEYFRRGNKWTEIRCDIEESFQPDVLASITDLHGHVEDASVDAIWGSHIIEHLARHEVPLALSEFVRVLTPSGFALIRTPDIEIVAQFILDGRLNDVIYTSPAGPITPLDMIYGHGAAIEQQRVAMRHGTAFTQELLGNDMLEAGFSEVRTTRTKTFEVWAVAFMPDADVAGIVEGLAQTGIDFRN